MKWVLLNARESFSQYVSTWDKLNNKLTQNNPMLNSAFIVPMIDTFATQKTFLAIYYKGDNIANMMLLEKKNSFHWVTFQPSQLQIAPCLIEDIKAIEEIFLYLGDGAIYLDLMQLDTLYSKELINFFPDKAKYATTFNIEIKGDYDNYLKERPKKLRNNLTRYHKKAYQKYKDIKLKRYNRVDEINPAYMRYAKMESSGWKGKAGTAISLNNIQGEFYRKILNNFCEINGANIYELYFADKMVASRIVIGNAMMDINLKTTYDENEKKFAPGRLLLKELVEVRFNEADVKYLEFYTNATKDQLAWASNKRDIYHVRVFRSAFYSQAFKLIKKIKYACSNIPFIQRSA